MWDIEITKLISFIVGKSYWKWIEFFGRLHYHLIGFCVPSLSGAGSCPYGNENVGDFNEEIKEFIKNKEEVHEKKVAAAKESGSLTECLCCYNDECLLEDMLACAGGHLFCKECIQRASEVCR